MSTGCGVEQLIAHAIADGCDVDGDVERARDSQFFALHGALAMQRQSLVDASLIKPSGGASLFSVATTLTATPTTTTISTSSTSSTGARRSSSTLNVRFGVRCCCFFCVFFCFVCFL